MNQEVPVKGIPAIRSKNQGNESGFTLIELLVVMGIMVMVSMIVGSIFVLSLRTAKKSNAVNAINQNGLYTLSVMQNMIRNSQAFKGVGNLNTSIKTPISTTNCDGSSTWDSVQFENPDGNLTTLSCNWQPSSTTPINIASISAMPDNTPIGTVGLLNTSDVNLVGGTCQFKCSQTYPAPPIISVQFSLQKYSFGIGTPGVSPLEENSAGTAFSTSVSLRNSD